MELIKWTTRMAGAAIVLAIATVFGLKDSTTKSVRVRSVTKNTKNEEFMPVLMCANGVWMTSVVKFNSEKDAVTAMKIHRKLIMNAQNVTDFTRC